MARLVLIAVILMGVAGVIAAILSLADRTTRMAGRQTAIARPKGALMQKTSYLLLVALMLYVSLWGGA